MEKENIIIHRETQLNPRCLVSSFVFLLLRLFEITQKPRLIGSLPHINKKAALTLFICLIKREALNEKIEDCW